MLPSRLLVSIQDKYEIYVYTQVPTRVFRDFYTCVSGYYRKSLPDRNRTQIKIIAIELSQYSISLLKTPALDFLLYYFDVTWRTWRIVSTELRAFQLSREARVCVRSAVSEFPSPANSTSKHKHPPAYCLTFSLRGRHINSSQIQQCSSASSENFPSQRKQEATISPTYVLFFRRATRYSDRDLHLK